MHEGEFMVRFFSFATLALVTICLLIGVSIAVADDDVPAPRVIEAIEPDHRMVDDSLAAVEDIYEFDFVVTARDEEHPEIITHSDILEI